MPQLTISDLIAGLNARKTYLGLEAVREPRYNKGEERTSLRIVFPGVQPGPVERERLLRRRAVIVEYLLEKGQVQEAGADMAEPPRIPAKQRERFPSEKAVAVRSDKYRAPVNAGASPSMQANFGGKTDSQRARATKRRAKHKAAA